MANISLYLIAIKEAIFGKDMREAVNKSIEAINRDTEDIAESRASTTEFGMVKLHASTTQGVLTNKSGLRIHPETEGLMVVTKPENGVRINGTGEIEINPADVNEAMTGTEDYKPITPVTLAGVLRAGRGVPNGSVTWAKCDADLQSRINTGGSSGVARDYDTTGGTIKAKFDEIDNGKAPKSHASTGTTYGKGTGSNYGHVKLSDAIDSASGANGGIAATPNAIKDAIAKACTNATRVAYGVCDGFGDAQDKYIDIENFSLNICPIVFVRFVYANMYNNPTLNVSNTGALPIYDGQGPARIGSWKENDVVEFSYQYDFEEDKHYWFVEKIYSDAVRDYDATGGTIKAKFDALEARIAALEQHALLDSSYTNPNNN